MSPGGEQSELLNSMMNLCLELKMQASDEIFQKIQEYANLAAKTALALQKQQQQNSTTGHSYASN